MSPTEIIYGLNPVLELLRARRRRCHEVLIAAGRNESDVEDVRKEAAKSGVLVKTIPREKFAEIVHVEKNQGVAARCDEYPYAILEDVVSAAQKDGQKGFLLVLDGITDPQNLGALIRTSCLMGVHGVIIPRDKAAGVTPTVVKASAGATELQNIVQVTNISNTLVYIKEGGFWVIGADKGSDESLYHHDFTGQNIAMVLGSEGKGIRRLVRDNCDFLLSIPMDGPIDSFNVSVAGALFLGEAARQRWISTHAKTVPNTLKLLDKK